MKTEAIERCINLVKIFETEIEEHRKLGITTGGWIDRATKELQLIKEAINR